MSKLYCSSLTEYKRLPTREVKIGNLLLGNGHAVIVQTMTTTDTLDTEATVAQCIKCIQAGAQMVRITAPGKKEAENLLAIKNKLRALGYNTPLIADIHFTPNAAEIAARIVEKVRVNPGNYIDKKKFEQLEYTDAEYAAEIDRIRERFSPLVKICKEHGTAMRLGTNHGSLSDRIMSRYGDSPMGMVESAMEFLRIARSEDYHQIVLSMKSSNPIVMVQAYRLLTQHMMLEFGECYPLHLGVTEAGDGEDGRIKSAIGIGTLMEDGIGDTIRVSLTEDPEFEIPVCKDLVKRYEQRHNHDAIYPLTQMADKHLPYNPMQLQRRAVKNIAQIGNHHVPIVVADLSAHRVIDVPMLKTIGYTYDAPSDKWHIADAAADYIYTGAQTITFSLPGTLKIICDYSTWIGCKDKSLYSPLLHASVYLKENIKIDTPHFVLCDTNEPWVSLMQLIAKAKSDEYLILCISSSNTHAMPSMRRFMIAMMEAGCAAPVIININADKTTVDEQLLLMATDAGALLLDGFGDGIWLQSLTDLQHVKVSGRTYLTVHNTDQFLNNTAFSILQATRTRISKTEYISCPSCGRTLFDLQETTAKIRNATNHLKGVKIAIMGCIVNGPGEMADADFGYVGSGVGKITLYRGKEVVKRHIPSETAVDELIQLLKDNGVWMEAAIAH